MEQRASSSASASPKAEVNRAGSGTDGRRSTMPRQLDGTGGPLASSASSSTCAPCTVSKPCLVTHLIQLASIGSVLSSAHPH